MRGKLYTFLFAAVLAVSIVSFSPSAQAFGGDSDNIPSSTENASPNNGDNNYDGTKDKVQSTVATTQNPNDTENPDAWVSLQVGDPESERQSSWQIDQFNPVDPNTLPSQPDGTIFPVGMFDIKLSCTQSCHQEVPVQIESFDETPVGDTVHLKLIFDRVMDTSKWTTQKYDPTTDTYIDYSPYVTISTQNIGYDRTVLEWDVVDGGFGDADGEINCQISDPIGPTIPVTAETTVATQATVATIEAVAQPTLANTGFSTNLILSIGVLLIAASVAIFPKRSRN